MSTWYCATHRTWMATAATNVMRMGTTRTTAALAVLFGSIPTFRRTVERASA